MIVIKKKKRRKKHSTCGVVRLSTMATLAGDRWLAIAYADILPHVQGYLVHKKTPPPRTFR